MAANFTPMLESLVWVEDPEETWSDGDQIMVICTSGKITYTGNILIAENPFRKLPHLYDIHMVAQYEGEAFGELSPHPFAVADASYRLMINEGISQSILVGGESEAGKTESRKLLMRCLAYMGGRGAAQGRSVELKVLDSNPVLEAFGNTKTARNNKSGRFGKFLEIQIDRSGRFSGAEIRTCLLEGSRACQVSDPEVYYHGFYMLRAAPPEEIQFKLGNPRSLYYLNQSNPYELDGVDDSKEYTVTRQPMDLVGSSTVGSSTDEQDAIFQIVAANFHLGNIEFAKAKEVDSLVPKLLMYDEKALEDFLCKLVIVTCSDFMICHYAGDITYQNKLFLEKNKDFVVAEHHALLGASRCPFIASLFPLLTEEPSKSKFCMEAVGISCAGCPTKTI